MIVWCSYLPELEGVLGVGAGASEAALAEVVARAQGAAVAASGDGEGVAATAGHTQVGSGALSEQPGRALTRQVLKV